MCTNWARNSNCVHSAHIPSVVDKGGPHCRGGGGRAHRLRTNAKSRLARGRGLCVVGGTFGWPQPKYLSFSVIARTFELDRTKSANSGFQEHSSYLHRTSCIALPHHVPCTSLTPQKFIESLSSTLEGVADNKTSVAG